MRIIGRNIMFAAQEAWKAGLWSPRHWAGNIVAGVIVGVVALPLAMAFAIASGVKPEQGLYTAIVAGVVVSLFGGSRVQIAGPTGAFIVILSGIVAEHGVAGLQLATLMAGLILCAFGLARQLDLERGAAKAYIERYFARYPGVAGYMATTRETAKARGYVETVFGRRLWLPEIHSPVAARRQAAERAAINAPMQGTAADLIKAAMIAVQGWLDAEHLQTRLLMQVHDELVLEVPESELPVLRREVPRLMSELASLRVPLVVDVGAGRNWDEAH